MRPERGLVSFVVPTYNERENLPRLLEALAQHVHRPYEVIVVDDGSPDGTAQVARELAAKHPVRVLERPGKAGLGSAYREGFRCARGEFLFEMDADLSHDPAFVEALARAVEEGAAVAVGSRYVPGGAVRGWSAYRRIVSRTGNVLARSLLRLPVRDATSGYRCYAREHADLVQDAMSDGYAFQVEVLHLATRRGLRIVEVPISFENRRHGSSKLATSEFARFLVTLGRLRWRAAPRTRRVGPA